MSAPLSSIPRRPYAITMGAATLVAMTSALLMASVLGGGAGSLAPIGIALAFIAAVSVIPLLGPPLVTGENWGLVVMACSGARTMLAMFAMLVLVEMLDLPRKPVLVALLVGTMVLIAAEAVAAVRLLALRESARALQADRSKPAAEGHGTDRGLMHASARTAPTGRSA